MGIKLTLCHVRAWMYMFIAQTTQTIKKNEKEIVIRYFILISLYEVTLNALLKSVLEW